MKPKSLLAFAALAATAFAFADVTSDTELCRITVDTKMKSTILSLPLVEVGSADLDATSLANLVMTNNLAQGTKLFATIKGTTYTWTLGEAGWETVPLVNGEASPVNAEDDGVSSIPRGTALWIERTGTDFSDPFYLYGQVGAKAETTQEMGVPVTTGTPKFTLVGNPDPEECDINTGMKWEGCQNGDQLIWGNTVGNLGDVLTYTWKDTAWGYDKRTGTDSVTINGKETQVPVYKWTTENINLPAGQGFWFVSKHAGSTRKVTWNKVN